MPDLGKDNNDNKDISGKKEKGGLSEFSKRLMSGGRYQGKTESSGSAEVSISVTSPNGEAQELEVDAPDIEGVKRTLGTKSVNDNISRSGSVKSRASSMRSNLSRAFSIISATGLKSSMDSLRSDISKVRNQLSKKSIQTEGTEGTERGFQVTRSKGVDQPLDQGVDQGVNRELNEWVEDSDFICARKINEIGRRIVEENDVVPQKIAFN